LKYGFAPYFSTEIRYVYTEYVNGPPPLYYTTAYNTYN
jgi:hypothetical protein